MENASKALLIAGGILISIIGLTMLIMMFSRIANLHEEQEERIKTEQLAAFNAEYEAYNKKLMYGADVITLLNKVSQNNKDCKNSADYKIDIKVEIQDGDNVITITNQNGNSLLEIEDSEKRIFKCTKFEYNDLGRVCNIEISTR